MGPLGVFGRSLCPVEGIRDAKTVDYVPLVLLWLAFASLTTLQVALAFAIGRHLGPLRGWLSLLAFPLAPYFGIRAGLRWRSVAWCALLICYCALLFFATR
jgi:hypothetical protein